MVTCEWAPREWERTPRRQDRLALILIDDYARDDGGDRTALERAAIKRRVAGFAGGFLDVEGPGAIERKNRDVGGFADGKLSIFAQRSGRSRGEKFNHAHKGNAPGVDELREGETDGRLETQDAERSFVELNIFNGGLVGCVVR